MSNQSYVTLATNDNYALGALTLANSLKNVQTTRLLTVLITNAVSSSLQEHLKGVFDHVIIVDVLDSNDSVNLALLKRPELGVTFTKLHCWRLVQFEKCVFLDADCLVLKNVDELFEREEFSAATDVGWPDCFNSGVFVFKPSYETYSAILNFALHQGSFDGGDQGLLNSFYCNWSTSDSSKRLPFIYNCTNNVHYSYAPAYNKYKDTVKIVHFIGSNKPWYSTYNLDSKTVVSSSQYESEHLNQWWSTFIKSVYPRLSEEIRDRVNVQLRKQEHHNQQQQEQHTPSHQDNYNSQPKYEEKPAQYFTGDVSSGGVIVGSEQHQNLWERGQIEYTGRDSFSNIQAHLDSQLNKK